MVSSIKHKFALNATCSADASFISLLLVSLLDRCSRCGGPVWHHSASQASADYSN